MKMSRWKIPLLVSVLLSLCYVFYFGNRAFVELDIRVTQITLFKIYWAEPGKPFSEENMVRAKVRPDQEHYRFFLTDLRKVERLRIDPHQYEGMAVIKKLTISQSGYSPIVLAEKDDFARLEPLDQIICSWKQTDGFYVFSSGVDPNFALIPEIQGSPAYLQDTVSIAAIVAAVFLFFFLTEGLREESRFIPLLFAGVYALIITMSGISAPEVHPDEYVHLNVSSYYMENWLPPEADDPSIRNTYSIYGFSRLNNHEVYYFCNGKLAKLLAPLRLPDYLRLRMFNLLLFGVMLLLVLRSPRVQLVALPFLISPQLWYVFSYCNSDAFALFITFFVGAQIVSPDSFFNRFLARKRDPAWIGQLLVLGLLLAVLFGLKKNYYFTILFMTGYVLWKNIFPPVSWDRSLFFKRAVLIVLAALCFMGIRVAIDYGVNGPDRAEKLARMRVETAAPLYNPNTPLEKMHSFLYRKARGDSLRKLVVDENWFGKTFRSAFGMYGYFTVSATDAYFSLVRLVGVGFLLFLTAAVLLRAPPPEKYLVALFYGCTLALIGTSLWHSWTSDFQTQGRYLFPLVPMLGMLVFHVRRYVPDAGFRLFLIAMFAISLYSYVYVALMYIPKAFLASTPWLPEL